MGALDVAKGGSPDDADGRVVICWRPREPSTRWSIAAAWFPGGSSKVKFLRMAAGDADDGASDDSDDDDAMLLERADAIAEYIVAGEPGLIDAARDKRAAGDKEVGTYYVVEFTSGAYELEKEYNSPDYGVLKAGARVLDVRYLDLVYGPDKTLRWYTPNPAKCVVPFELVLHASFGMATARRCRLVARLRSRSRLSSWAPLCSARQITMPLWRSCCSGREGTRRLVRGWCVCGVLLYVGRRPMLQSSLVQVWGYAGEP